MAGFSLKCSLSMDAEVLKKSEEGFLRWYKEKENIM